MHAKRLLFAIGLLIAAQMTQAQTATFSCMVNGKPFSGSGSNTYANIGIHTTPGIINFILVRMEKTNGVPEQIQFMVKPSGKTAISNNDGKYSVTYSPGGVGNDLTLAGATVTVTSSSNTRLAGSFSAKFVHSSDDKVVQITDGRFDIPMKP